MGFREMLLIFGLMLLLQTACACLDRFCWLNQTDPCYAALGHKLNLLMALNTSDMKIQKRISNNSTTDPVCRVKYGRMRDCDLYSNRPEVTVINGTLIINRVIRADSGNYTLKLDHRSDGSETSTDLQVNVEAPVGSVEVSIRCSSSGAMRASCSSEGDQLLYSWTLNGDPLMDGNPSTDLDEGTDGSISCSVKNHVSHGQTAISLKPCSVLHVSLIALGCVALILILLFITVYHAYKKKQVKSTAPAGSADIIYADISHKKKGEKKKRELLPAADAEYVEVKPQKKRKERKEKEEEVQYGEVMFTLNCSNAHLQPQDECVYSQVHTQQELCNIAFSLGN
ncbi:uncharacterized protein [Sinocyclocheilus grahami]|uniref:uncharacterized protein isoform X2 n=1 Tax=Sinocyclocheilus grahami TaxID=75366 RepID=UPI0007AD128E|nr:PREDICTED: uncharacterized protein LOC107568126 isoform X2 [Sinocyclocheilus grahami]